MGFDHRRGGATARIEGIFVCDSELQLVQAAMIQKVAPVLTTPAASPHLPQEETQVDSKFNKTKKQAADGWRAMLRALFVRRRLKQRFQ